MINGDGHLLGPNTMMANAIIETVEVASAVLDKQVKHISPEFYKDKIVLDAGCGEGRLIKYFVKHGARMGVGIDISREYMMSGLRNSDVVVCNEKFKFGKKEKVVFIHSSAGEIPLKDSSVDTIIAFALLHHISDKSNFISECKRILVNGGNLVVVDPNGGHFLRNLINRLGRKFGFLTEAEKAIKIGHFNQILNRFQFSIKQIKFESFFGDIATHLSLVIYKKNRLFGKMIQCLIPFCFVVDLFLDVTLFKIFPSLAWRYFLVARKEQVVGG